MLDEWNELILVLVGGAALPLVSWFARGAFESWRHTGIYVAKIDATGSAPCLEYSQDGLPYVGFSIGVKVLNASSDVVVLENAAVSWKHARSPQLRQLDLLRDAEVDIIPVDDYYKETADTLEKFSCQLPPLIQSKGGVGAFRLECRLLLFGKSFFGRRQRLSPPNLLHLNTQERIEFTNQIDRGSGLVELRLSGKIRSFPIQFW